MMRWHHQHGFCCIPWGNFDCGIISVEIRGYLTPCLWVRPSSSYGSTCTCARYIVIRPGNEGRIWHIPALPIPPPPRCNLATPVATALLPLPHPPHTPAHSPTPVVANSVGLGSGLGSGEECESLSLGLRKGLAPSPSCHFTLKIRPSISC